MCRQKVPVDIVADLCNFSLANLWQKQIVRRTLIESRKSMERGGRNLYTFHRLCFLWFLVWITWNLWKCILCPEQLKIDPAYIHECFAQVIAIIFFQMSIEIVICLQYCLEHCHGQRDSCTANKAEKINESFQPTFRELCESVSFSGKIC